MQLKTVSNFKATANFFNFLTLKKEKKSCNKSVNFILISLFDDLITTYFPFLRDISPKNRMLCLRNAYETFKTFSRFYSLYLETYNWLVLFIHETFLVYKLETFKNCKEVKHIMIMIITIIYFFISDVIFAQQLKITFRISSGPPWKNPLPLFYSFSPLP